MVYYIFSILFWLIWNILAFAVYASVSMLATVVLLYLDDPSIACEDRGDMCDFSYKRRHALKIPAKFTVALIIVCYVYCNSGASPIAQVKMGIMVAWVEWSVYVFWRWAWWWPESNWNNAVGFAYLAGLWCIAMLSTLIVEAKPLGA